MPERADGQTDADVVAILRGARVVAVIGASPDPRRDSNGVMGFLKRRGYRVIPVNPTCVGDEIHGEKTVASLKDIEEQVDMVDVFRRSEDVGPVVDDAIAVGAKVVWMQLGIVNQDAARRAREAGMQVVMDRCPRIEMARLNIAGPE